MKLTMNLNLVLRLRILGVVFPFPNTPFIAWCLIKQCTYFHDVVLKLSIGATLSGDYTKAGQKLMKA
jgi:uncharacterized membrane protein YbaN (DUF454 family)